VRLAIEPLNRYESDIVNTAEEGLADQKSIAATGLLLDTFHMNSRAVLSRCSAKGKTGRAVVARPSWRQQSPAAGQGHTDFASIVTTLRESVTPGFFRRNSGHILIRIRLRRRR
jgi:D-psicose/D-tagatose/L-ribulose 3-epimerase